MSLRNLLGSLLFGAMGLIAAFLVVYGAWGGLVKRRIVRSVAKETYYTGREAVAQGLLRIVVGGVALWLIVRVLGATNWSSG